MDSSKFLLVKQTPCTEAGCDRYQVGRGLCRNHYQNAWNRALRATRPKRVRVKDLPCVVGGCGELVHAKELCYYHYNRQRYRIKALAAPAKNRRR